MVEATTKKLSEDTGDDLHLEINVNKDITGWTFTFILEGLKGEEVVKKEVTNHDDAGNGETSIEISNSETENLHGKYHYKLRYEDDTGWKETVMKGPFQFS